MRLAGSLLLVICARCACACAYTAANHGGGRPREVDDQYVGIAFDGTTRLGEAINTTGRWCTKDFCIRMRLLDFTTLKQHVDTDAQLQRASRRVEV